jgi:hypothetical protein
MAQVAIPLVIAGALYLMSNGKKDRENFEGSSIDEPGRIFTDSERKANESYKIIRGINGNDTSVNAPYKLLKDKTTDFYGKLDESKFGMNNQGDYSQHQDKYYLGRPKDSKTGDEFKDLADNQVLVKDLTNQMDQYESLTGKKADGSNANMNHNNMSIFYNSKSYGNYKPENNIIDNYTGSGYLTIDKREISTLFKPEQNMQNVYGNQNQSEFYMSRVNESLRKANTVPWEKISDSKGEVGFNWAAADRDKSMPKSVDDLRATNNPKSNYANNYRAPAYDPKQVTSDQNLMGKFVKKGPDTFHTNDMSQGIQIGVPGGMEKPMNIAVQMLTKEQRETTNVEYYGLMSSESMGYTEKGERYIHKQQLGTDTVLNMTNQGINPTTAQNYGKESYKALSNNRDNSEDYYGNVRGVFLANVVDPIVKTLKHTKKSNKENSKTGNLKGCVKPIIFNPHEMLSTTNREMDVEKLGLNHLTVERQQGTGYLSANPYLEKTQRESTNNEIYGNANGIIGSKTRSYNAEYNQRNIQKPIENRIPNGNAKEYNTNTNYCLNKQERTNDYVPFGSGLAPNIMDRRMLGENTSNPSQYQNINDDYRSADLLKAFKANPYTQPLHSVA